MNTVFQEFSCAVSTASVSDGAALTTLFAAEEAALGVVAEKRQRDFALGRHCARVALGRIGIEATAILPGPSREPIWPAGVCGSITHCDGYWAAAVTPTITLRSIGIDAEPITRRFSDDALRLISTPVERAWLRSAAAPAGVPWDLLLFSAKESVYKAWFPVARRWLGFEEAEITFDPAACRFAVRLQPADRDAATDALRIQGRYEIGRTHLFTGAWIEPDAALTAA